MNYSKFIVALVIFLNVIFTIAIYYSFLKTQSEPITLITAWFAFTTGELWTMGLIKIKENNNSNTNKKVEIRKPTRIEYFDNEVEKND